MGRPRLLNAGGIDPIAEEPHPPHAAAAADGDPAGLACAISAEASAVLAVMCRSLCHPRAAAADADAAANHPLVSSLKALRRLVFSPAAAATPSLPAAMLRPFLDAVRSEEGAAAVTSASLAAHHEVMALTGPSLLGAALREVVPSPAAGSRPGPRPPLRRPC